MTWLRGLIARLRKSTQVIADRLRGRKAIYGRDWNYTDERKDKIIGYARGGNRLTITDRKTWLEILP